MSTPSSDRRPRLRDIVRGNVDDFKRRFDEAKPSTGFDPLPPGIYRCLAVEGKVFAAKSETEGFKVTFEVVVGPFTGRKVWFDIWMTDKSMPMAKGELAKLGITNSDQLEQPLSPGLIADVTVVQHTDDNGVVFNRVRTFKVVESSVPADDYRPAADLVRRKRRRGRRTRCRRSSLDPSGITREPGEDDDLDDDGFGWRTGIQHTSSTPLLDAAKNGKGTT